MLKYLLFAALVLFVVKKAGAAAPGNANSGTNLTQPSGTSTATDARQAVGIDYGNNQGG